MGHEGFRYGWGCQCRVAPVRPSEYTGQSAPDDGTYEKTDRFGRVHEIPKGVDYGWDYAPGAKTDVSLRSMVQEKLIRYKPAISRALSHDVNRYVNAHEDISDFAGRAMERSGLHEVLWLGFVENPEPIRKAIDIDTTGFYVLLPSDGIDHVEKHHRHDGGGQRPALPVDYETVWRVLAEGDITQGEASALGLKRIIAQLKIGAETFRAVFEVRTGKKNRALALVSLVIKTGR